MQIGKQNPARFIPLALHERNILEAFVSIGKVESLDRGFLERKMINTVFNMDSVNRL